MPATPTFEALASGQDLAALYAQFPVNIAPPTDDSPFFFHMLLLRDIFNGDLWRGDLGGTRPTSRPSGCSACC